MAIQDLGEVLKKLYSDEARAKLIYQAMDNYTMPKEYVEKAIKWYERAGKTKDAIAVATKAENKEKIVEIYERAAQFEAAADVARDIPLKARTDALYNKALETYEQEKKFDAAASLATKLMMPEKAEEFYRRAVEEYSSKELYGSAAEVAEKKGMTEWAQALYEKALGSKRAILYDWMKSNTNTGSALDENEMKAFEKVGRYEKAAEIAKRLDMQERAIEMFEKAGKWAEAGEIAEEVAFAKKRPVKKTGNKLEALIEKIKTINSSQIKFLTKTIDNYEKAGWYDSAVAVAQRAGLTETAIQVYERAGRFHDAAAIAKKAGTVKRAMDVYEKAGDYSSAANVAEKAGLLERKAFYEALHWDICFVKNEEKVNLSSHLATNLSEKIKKKYDEIAPEKHVISIYQRTKTSIENFLYDLGLSFAKDIVFRGIKYGIPMLLGTGIFSAVGSISQCHQKEKTWGEVQCSLIPAYFDKGKFCRTYQWDAHISLAEKVNNIPKGLLAGIVMAESSGNPVILNKNDDGSAGFFQIPPSVMQGYGVPLYDKKHIEEREYGKKLRKLAEMEGYEQGQLEQYDSRFGVGLSAFIVGKYLKEKHAYIEEQQKNNPLFPGNDAWDLAIASYKKPAHQIGNCAQRIRYINKVKEYQRYYLRGKHVIENHSPK